VRAFRDRFPHLVIYMVLNEGSRLSNTCRARARTRSRTRARLRWATRRDAWPKRPARRKRASPAVRFHALAHDRIARTEHEQNVDYETDYEHEHEHLLANRDR
jgi:hypothetical protein